ncbi:MAG TPA: sigma-70 family RNA polymerase sigma factor [Bacteroidia bacterium]|nr:sigma-70 family RNA polymerase sigma factor [Bacteroidia bacterium]
MWFIKTGNKNKSDDAGIISLYKETGDNLYVGILFERYSHLAFGVCMKYLKNEDDSKDAVLQIFENIMKDLKRFNIKSFAPWLHSVAKNHCLMQLRKKRMVFNDEKGVQQAEATLLTIPSNMAFMNEDVTEEHLKGLDAAIESLNAEQNKCIRLFYLQEKSYQEVALLTGYNMNEVKSHIQNGKRNLKNYLVRKHSKVE